MTSRAIRKVTISASARLHLGFIDLHGGLGRRYGSLGVLLHQPRYVIEVIRTNSDIIISGKSSQRVRSIIKTLVDYLSYRDGLKIKVSEAIPEHVGLGSGTQLTLAIGAAITTLQNKPLDTRKLAEVCGRGEVSGAGTALFSRGGFVIDGGHPIASPQMKEESLPVSVPPMIVHHSIPEDWTFIVVIPNVSRGLSGVEEKHAFSRLAYIKPEPSKKISRLILMKLLPALVEEDIVNFGQALTEIQILVGDSFISAQGGRFSSPEVETCIQTMLDAGAYGAGQSSWGPACYGLTKGVDAVKKLKKAITHVLDANSGGSVFESTVNNQGVQISTQT